MNEKNKEFEAGFGYIVDGDQPALHKPLSQTVMWERPIEKQQMEFHCIIYSQKSIYLKCDACYHTSNYTGSFPEAKFSRVDKLEN